MHVPLLSVQLPSVVAPDCRVTTPVGVPLPVEGATVTVPVIVPPYVLLVLVTVRLVVVAVSGAGGTVIVKAEEVLPVKFESPA